MANNEIGIVIRCVLLLRQKGQREIRKLMGFGKQQVTIDMFAYFTDIDVDNPDKKLIIMYLTELYNYLEGNKAKERVCNLCLNR